MQDFIVTRSQAYFEDLANMNKTLSISVGLNSHAGNEQDTPRHTHAKPHRGSCFIMIDTEIILCMYSIESCK